MDAMERIEQDHFVGREKETEAFIAWWDDAGRQKRLIHVSGTAGIGKSMLLKRFRRLAERRGGLTVSWDARSLLPDPADWCKAILRQLGPDAPELQQEAEACRTADEWLNACILGLERGRQGRQALLLLDHYDAAGARMDEWLRRTFLPLLDTQVLVVTAGRQPLAGWSRELLWQKLLLPMPLASLDESSVASFAERNGITNPLYVRRLSLLAKGHPLTLALAAGTRAYEEAREGAESPLYDTDGFGLMLTDWLAEIEGDQRMELLEAAAMLRHFDQELLSALIGAPVGDASFESLIRPSFVYSTDRGWTVHELLRDGLRHRLRKRNPGRYEHYVRAAALWFREKLRHARSFERSAHEAESLLYYAGSPVIQAHYFTARPVPYSVELVDGGNVEEAVRYVRDRRAAARDLEVECGMPNAGVWFAYKMTAEESLLRVHGVDPERLLAEGAELRLIRHPDGRAAGLSVAVPICGETMDYLKRAPLSSAYFGRLEEKELQALLAGEAASPGWFIHTIDVDNLENEEQRTVSFQLMLSYLFSAGLLVCSPPPLPYYKDAYESFGFLRAEGAEHTAYDGKTAASTYVLDLRGEKLQAFADRQLEAAGMLAGAPPQMPRPESGRWTEREMEVLPLLLQGKSNAEIASRLFVSVITVKKHVSSIYRKCGARNRIDLLRIMGAEGR